VRREGLRDRFDNTVVGSAPTDVSTHAFANFRLVEHHRRGSQIIGNIAGDVPFDLGCHPDGGTELPWRAIAALEAIMFNECLLKGMQIAVNGKTFDGGDVPPLILHGQSKTGVDTLSIDQNRASAAGSLIASLFCAGEPERVAKEVEERRSYVCRCVNLKAIDCEMHA
jgi:hypothetical protein